MKNTPKILDKAIIQRCLVRLAHEVLEKNAGTKNLVLIGIRKRGVYLAQRLQGHIEKIDNENIPVGILDITLYRDDLSQVGPNPIVHKTEIDFDITGKNVILVDDVLYTGRTIRAALDALTDLGRPALIQLAVLVDRGHRELPIRPDYVGKNIPTAKEQLVEVHLEEIDDADEVLISEKGDSPL